MLFEQVKETMVETLNCDEEKIVPEASIADDLNIDSLDAVELVMALEEKRKTDEIRQKQIEVEKRAYMQARYEVKNHSNTREKLDGDWLKSKADRTGVAETKAETYYYGERIIGSKTSFATHADALNACFGFSYKHFQKAYKDLENGYAVWFPNIARKIDDHYISTDDYFGWVNILSDSGDTITQIDKANSEPGRRDYNKRVIFA